MIRTSTATLAAVALTGLAGTATANHIDFFEEGQFTLLLLPGQSSVSDTQTDVDGDTIFGNTRNVQMTFAPGDDTGAVLAAQLDVQDGVLVFSNSAGTQATLSLGYGSTDTLNVVDPVPYARFGIEVVDLEGGDVTATATATDNGGDSDTATVTLDSTGQFFIDYSDFDSSVDLTMLDTLTFDFVGDSEGVDLTLGSITREVIPEPAALSLAGLAGLALVRRRRA